MYNANAQNSILRIRTELNECSYNQNMKDYLANLIMSVMNFPKKTQQVRHFIKTMGGNRIIMVWYPMSVPFMGKNYNVPLQIYITKNMPYEPPQIFLEVTQGSGANTKNTDIDPNNNIIDAIKGNDTLNEGIKETKMYNNYNYNESIINTKGNIISTIGNTNRNSRSININLNNLNTFETPLFKIEENKDVIDSLHLTPISFLYKQMVGP